MRASDFDFAMGEWIFKAIIGRKLGLAKMKAPFTGSVLILHGRQDPSEEGAALTLERYYQQSKLVFVKKCGHYSWVEQPDNVLAEVGEFFLSNDKI